MAKILTNNLELFKKYYWQIVTASQMLIQQQLLVLVFCRKARGFTFRNISLSKLQLFDDSGPTLFICYSHPVTKYCIPDFWNQLFLLPDFWIQDIKDFSHMPENSLLSGFEFIKLRYESSTLIFYKELSSSIFQSLSVSQSVSQASVTPV